MLEIFLNFNGNHFSQRNYLQYRIINCFCIFYHELWPTIYLVLVHLLYNENCKRHWCGKRTYWVNIGCILIIIGSRGLHEVFIKLLFLRGKLEIKIAHRLNASVMCKSYFENSGLSLYLKVLILFKTTQLNLFNRMN